MNYPYSFALDIDHFPLGQKLSDFCTIHVPANGVHGGKFRQLVEKFPTNEIPCMEDYIFRSDKLSQLPGKFHHPIGNVRIGQHEDHLGQRRTNSAYRGFFLCLSALSRFFLLWVFILLFFRFLPQGILPPLLGVVQCSLSFNQGAA